jgi:glutamine amidotransferase-like uncharacterized protein
LMAQSRQTIRLLLLVGMTTIIAGCAMPLGDDPSSPGTTGPSAAGPTTSRPPRRTDNGSHSGVLIYDGASSWEAEVDSLAEILASHQVPYREVSSAELDAMSLENLSGYSLLIIPGGDAPTITNSLSAQTHARLRAAVQERGLSYLGFCAGAWLAISPAPEPGHDVSYGIGFVSGPIQQETIYHKQGKEFAIVDASLADGTKRDLLWYGGPITPNVSGGVIARYPDGNPAITEMWSGQGLVIVSGLHPAATQGVFATLGVTSRNGVSFDLAWKLLDAGIRQQPLPGF